MKYLRKPNVRRAIVDEAAFEKVLEAAEPHVRPILLVAFDTGCAGAKWVEPLWLSEVTLTMRP